MPEPTQMEDYLFDLQGYIILRNAVGKEEVKILNEALDPYTSMDTDEWRENKPWRAAHRHLSLRSPLGTIALRTQTIP